MDEGMSEGTKSLEALMAAANAGDQKAYAQALQATSQFLRPYLSKRLNQPSEVEDVLQEILISIHKSRHSYDGKRPFKPWAYAIAKFRLSDFLRAHYGDTLRNAAELDAAEDIAQYDVTENGISYESIKEEIAKLPGKQPTILHLLHHEGHTAKEVAAKMGMTETAVKVAAHRAYKVLKGRLSG
jgi:RNA polymerase sigma-70 factor, ECF subfamily